MSAASRTSPQNVDLMLNISAEIQALAAHLLMGESGEYSDEVVRRAAVVRILGLGELIASMAEGIDDIEPALKQLHGVVQ